MKKKELINTIARLESLNDQLIAELQYINEIMIRLGFTNGIKTLKSAAEELINEQDTYIESDDDSNPPLAG